VGLDVDRVASVEGSPVLEVEIDETLKEQVLKWGCLSVLFCNEGGLSKRCLELGWPLWEDGLWI
jgi:hypothetical protein